MLGIRPLTARILVARGLLDADRVKRFLSPRLADLRPPDGMSDLPRAIDRLSMAARNRERVAVFGDYDVDGVSAAAVLALGFRAFDMDVLPRVARRQAGYGLQPSTVSEFCAAGCRLLVTADCGTSDLPALELARERGLDVIVIDHHQVPSGDSPAFALINPHRADDRFPFKGMASCGLAFYLVASLRSRLATATFDPRDLLDVVTLGTIADLVPLKDENRIFVSAGLRVLAGRRRPGLRALIEQAELGDRDISERDVGFRLTPRLNSAGRLGDAQLALDLLLAPDDATGRTLAAELEEKNRERQRIQEEVWQEAVVAAAEWEHAPAIVVAGKSWHPGVLGIVAARLVDRFGKPAVAIGFGRATDPSADLDGSAAGSAIGDSDSSPDEPEGRGSARTPTGLDLYGTMSACADHLVRFGGHAGAAGLSIRSDQVPAFRRAFISEVERRATARDDSLWVVDGVVDLSEVDVRLAEELSRLAPFGVANAEPVLAIPSVTALSTRVVGEKHLQLSLGRLGARGDAIAFHMAGADPGRGATLDLIAMADLDLFGGIRRARLRVKHLAATSTSRHDGPPDA